MRLTITGAGLAFALPLSAGACDLVGPNREEFVVQIDSLAGASAVSSGASFQQYLYGGLGPDGCYQLKTVQLTQNATGADVTVHIRIHQANGTVLTKIMRVE